MKITILTSGSRGDTQPYIALGLALKQAGHSVRLAAFENYESFVRSYGLDYFKVRGDVTSVAAGKSGQNAAKVDNPLKLLLSFNELKDHLFDLQQDFFNACKDSDIIVYHPGAVIGYFAARHFNIPSILATPFPLSPTREYPSLIFYDMPRLSKGYNYITHKVLEQIFWFASTSPLKAFLKKEFGQLPSGFANPFPLQTTHKNPTIMSCSEYVFHTPADRLPNVHTTGYWFLDEDWTPSPELHNFLQKGSAPVYIGFGSMGSFGSAEQTTALVIEALQRSGQRGVLASGWDGMSKKEKLPENIYMLESAPHSWLFPRMAAVVHHGGAGTTAEGLRAGVPSIIIPHANDQFAWGRRVYELGVGPKPIRRKKLTSENLAEAIRSALTDEVKSAARELGAKIRTERGAETAAKIILDSVLK
jgi:sterol 3beta-glucosyltransferase